MSSTDKTDPGIKQKAKNLAKKADPIADRILYKITGSEYSAVIIVVVVVALIGLGLWLSRG